MFPLLPFAAGLLTGAAAIKLWRNESTRAGIDKAQERLRQATASGLSAIKNTSVAIGKRLTPDEPPEVAVAAPLSEPAKTSAKPRKSRVAKTATPADADKPVEMHKKPRARKAAKATVVVGEETP